MKRLLITALLFGMLSFPTFCTAQDSDRDEEQLIKSYLYYGAKALGANGDYSALVVGSMVTAEILQDEKIIKQLSQINQFADGIIVGNESLKEPLSKLTGLKVYVSEKYFDEVETEIGSSKYWVLISKKDNELSRFVSARDLTRMIAGTKKVENRLKNSTEKDD